MSSEEKKKGSLIILSAPSGTGKTTVVNRLLARCPKMRHSISYTTRQIRHGEVHGKDYYFTPKDKFKSLTENNFFAEWEEVHSNFYGTPRGPLDQSIEEGKNILLDIDVKGGLRLKQMYEKNVISIFLLPPSIQELERRLQTRGTDSEETQKRRLENAKKEMTFKDQYHHQVINDSLEQTCDIILRLVDGLNVAL